MFCFETLILVCVGQSLFLSIRKPVPCCISGQHSSPFCIMQNPILANVLWLSYSFNCSVLNLHLSWFLLVHRQFSLYYCLDFCWFTGSSVCVTVLCTSSSTVFFFPSWEMIKNESSNFFTWILLSLRKCNVIKQNHLQMVKWAVQPSAIKAMMCLLNKVCFSKHYETSVIGII